MLDIPVYLRGMASLEGRERIIKLSSNENPLGCSPLALQALIDTVQQSHRYPEVDDIGLRKALADYFSLNADLIYCGGGSDQIMALLVLAYARTGDEVIHSENGFMRFRVYAQAAGATPVAVPDVDFCSNVDHIVARVTDRTRLIMLANPDNPSGAYLPKSEILRLHRNIPDNVLLVLDGAYAEYATAEDYDACADLVEQHENVVMSRTFSKIFGLAAVRLGWLYAPEQVVDALKRIELSFPMNGMAPAAGQAALSDQAFTQRSQKHNADWLNWSMEQLSALGLRVYPSQTNFMLAQFNDPIKNSVTANRHLLNHGIIGRMFDKPALKSCIRISVGLEEEMRLLVGELEKFLTS